MTTIRPKPQPGSIQDVNSDAAMAAKRHGLFSVKQEYFI